jgi:transglutaminase/protease-like cytokinesis protein 3
MVFLISMILFFSNLSGQSEVVGDSTKTNQYAELDKYAREAPENISKSSTQLAQYLEKKGITDLEKARLIFTWIAIHIDYDDKGYNSGKYPEQTAKNILKKRAAVCAGYSSLFHELAQLMGLKSEIISGYAKGYGYTNGQRITKVNHDWNAVKINGSWELMDATWGNGYGERTKSGLKSTKEFDDYWFMTPPDEFRFSHLPVNDKWQLVRPKISLMEFTKLPSVNGASFKLGFNANEILKSSLNGNSSRVVRPFKSHYAIKVLEIPYHVPLVVGREYKFKFQSSQIRNMAFVENGNWTLLEKEGNIFSGAITPRLKTLGIFIAIAPKYKYGEPLMIYEVVE